MSDQATVVLQQFNDTFTELLEDLARVFPDDEDFQVYKFGALTALMHTEDLVRSMFHEKVVVPFAGQLLGRDEMFFLSNDYSTVAHEFQDAEDVITKLKMKWSELGAQEKDAVWKYLRVLVLLDRKTHVFNQYYFDLLKRVKAWGKNTKTVSKAARDALRAIKEHYATYDLASEDHLKRFVDATQDLRTKFLASDDLADWHECDDVMFYKGIPASTLITAVGATTLKHFLTTLFSLTYELEDTQVNAMLKVAKDEDGVAASDLEPEDVKRLWERLKVPVEAPGDDVPELFKDIEDTSLGRLAKEIMEEVDLSKLSSNLTEGGDILQALSSPDSGVASLLTTVSQKMVSKLATGEIKQETLLSDAMKLAGQLGGKGMGGGNGLMNMGTMLSSLQGLMGAAGADGGSDLDLGDMASMLSSAGLGRGSALGRRAAVQKRMKRKLEQKRAERANMKAQE